MWLLGALASSLGLRGELSVAFDSGLEETAQRILPLAVTEILNREQPGLSQNIAPLRAPPVIRGHQELISYVVRDAAGAVLLTSDDVDLTLFINRPHLGFRNQAGYRIYGESAVSDSVFIEIAEPLVHREAAMHTAMLALLMPLLFLIPLSLLGIWLWVRVSLHSVLAYQEAIAARGAGDLSPIIAPALLSEMAPLNEAVNQLLHRLRRALESERSFTANSAHELRTPLASALAQVQRLRRATVDGPLQERVRHIEQSLQQLSRLSEKLLQLAKAEGGALVTATPYDVEPVLRYVLSELSRLDPKSVLHLVTPKTSAVLSIIDVDALSILLRNLIENARNYGTQHAPITVQLSSRGVLRVSNSGPVLPAEALAGLSARFVRATHQHSCSSSSAGSGLGLAIVQAIALGAGGHLTLFSPAPGCGDGFAAEVQLPVSHNARVY